MKKLSSAEIRNRFLKFFEKNGHRVVPSSSLVPRLDPTLLFTNAGMNQFKGVFIGEEKRDYKRAASSQKCVRAGGKHNDLENVGRTARHHTFFEMLGNFSFGDYFKKEAVRFAWTFCTEELKVPKDRLYVSVFTEDDAAFGIWKNDIGIAEKRIYRFGAKDNFWAMGESGPCGPCSEIFFDQGAGVGCGKPTCDVGCDCDRYIEFWNLVFMEFNQRPDGTRAKLPKPSIDTGMGLERITAIVQGVTSNYDTDLFSPIFGASKKISGKEYKKAAEEEKISLRVIADHVRAMTFLIADGVQPSNEGRGYVLRRIMRRAMRHGRKLGIGKPFLHVLSGTVVEEMGAVYPELKRASKAAAEVIRQEEERFAETIDRGLTLLSEEMDKLKKKGMKTLPGDIAFRLYDTYGFPVDMTADILRETGFSYDHEGFEEAFERHREKARGSWKGSADKEIDLLVRKWVGDGLRTEFLGYRQLTAEGSIRAIVKDGKAVQSAKAGDAIEILADRTPFYGESGGQVGDIGAVSGEGFSLEVVDARKPAPEIILHKCRVTEGDVRAGVKASFSVDAKARAATAKNHTATHMLHATLKELLGSHVSQSGSLVSPERLRFDFAHPAALTPDEIAQIEQWMNERIWLDAPVAKEILPLEKALATGAVALFDEKYGAEVRVISLGDYSKELCGGTHLERTGEIGLFKIIKESSVAAGIRRIDAVTGYRALRYVQDADQKLKGMASLLGVPAEDVGDRVEQVLQRQKELEKELRKKSSGPAQSAGKKIEPRITEVKGIRIATAEIDGADHKELRELADRYLEELKSGVVALATKVEGKALIVVKVSKDLSGQYPAGKLIQSAAALLGGTGGGRPEMAQAGGPRVEGIPEALIKIQDAI